MSSGFSSRGLYLLRKNVLLYGLLLVTSLLFFAHETSWGTSLRSNNIINVNRLRNNVNWVIRLSLVSYIMTLEPMTLLILPLNGLWLSTR